MADFNTGLTAPQGAGAQPLAPVQRDVSNFGNPLIGLAGQLTGIFLQNKKEEEQKRKADAQQQVINEFTQSQVALADAEKQGVDPARIASMARANYAKYVTNNPHLSKEFSEVDKNLWAHTNLGEFKEVEQSRQDAVIQLKKDFQASGGFIPDGASPELVNNMLSNFQIQRQKTAAFEQQVKINTEARAKEGADRNRTEWELKQGSVRLLSEIGASQLPISQEVVLGAVEKARKGNVEGANNDLLIHFSNIEGAIASAASANPELAGQWRSLFDNLKTTGIKALEGKTELDALKQQLETVITKGKLTALQDPNMVAVTVTSQLLGGQIPELFWQSNKAAQNAIMRLGASSDPTTAPPVIGDKAAEKLSFSMIEHNMKLINSGKADNPEAVQVQVTNATNNLLHQVGKAASTGIQPEQLKSTAEFLASPTFAQLVEKKMVDKQAVQNANMVMNVMYQQNVEKVISKKLSEDVQMGSGYQAFGGEPDKPVKFSEAIKIDWNGAGVAFKPKPVDPLYRDELDTRLLGLKPVEKEVNKIIHMGAHMEGHTDYAKYWEENKHNIMPTIYPEPEMLKLGQVVDGYKYLGGNDQDAANWVKEETPKKE